MMNPEGLPPQSEPGQEHLEQEIMMLKEQMAMLLELVAPMLGGGQGPPPGPPQGPPPGPPQGPPQGAMAMDQALKQPKRPGGY